MIQERDEGAGTHISSTPEGAEALSPGHRPGSSCSQTWRPVR